MDGIRSIRKHDFSNFQRAKARRYSSASQGAHPTLLFAAHPVRLTNFLYRFVVGKGIEVALGKKSISLTRELDVANRDRPRNGHLRIVPFVADCTEETEQTGQVRGIDKMTQCHHHPEADAVLITTLPITSCRSSIPRLHLLTLLSNWLTSRDALSFPKGWRCLRCFAWMESSLLSSTAWPNQNRPSSST